jgi:hypothetical protein
MALQPLAATSADEVAHRFVDSSLGGCECLFLLARRKYWSLKLMLSLDDLRNLATIATALVALLVFIFNVWSQVRNRRIENLSRFNQAHQQMFARNGYLAKNLKAIESGKMVRDHDDPADEAKFHLMLLEVERLAILANNKAVPRSTQIYMFGSYAPAIRKLMTVEESDSMFWELAREYLDGLQKDAERYAKLKRSERAQFWR